MAQKRQTSRVALVTGAGRGIGRAIGARLLQDGIRVFFTDKDKAAANDAADEYQSDALHADVSSEDDVAAAIASVVGSAGRLDIVVNNAAVSDPFTGPLEELSRETWDQYLSNNITGAMLVCKHSVAHLRRQNGCIINIASTRALQSEPESEAYAAAKGGLVALSDAMAISLGPAIRVNTVLPGWIATAEWEPRGERSQPELRDIDHRQHPTGRVGRPEDIASLCAWLSSEDASFITGASFVVDGGMTRKMIYED